ncbi:hypothetical protein [Demequina aurantiaca]|uniref:hypothetical protein n=1 Tax=Demequina aurantiaca TaxID=676200 RepID=UPI000780F729|nr:hypothetical protein [Demequina aurantiaca]
MNWTPVVAGIVPSIGVGLVFWYAMRGVLRADRNERAALAAADAEYDAEQARVAKEILAKRAESEDSSESTKGGS